MGTLIASPLDGQIIGVLNEVFSNGGLDKIRAQIASGDGVFDYGRELRRIAWRIGAVPDNTPGSHARGRWYKLLNILNKLPAGDTIRNYLSLWVGDPHCLAIEFHVGFDSAISPADQYRAEGYPSHRESTDYIASMTLVCRTLLDSGTDDPSKPPPDGGERPPEQIHRHRQRRKPTKKPASKKSARKGAKKSASKKSASKKLPSKKPATKKKAEKKSAKKAAKKSAKKSTAKAARKTTKKSARKPRD